MVSKVFTPGTIVDSAWLNDVNNAVYNASSAVALNSIVAKYGAVGDGVANDTAAFSAAEASADIRIFLPAGIYIYNGVPALTKYYYGDGQIKVNGTLVGQTYSNVTVATPALSSPAAYGEGDINHVNVKKWTLNGNRVSTNQYYFDARTTPEFVEFTNNTGHSGGSARITSAISIGSTSCTVNAVGTQLVPGASISIGDPSFGAPTDKVTITTVVGNTVSWTPAATIAIPYSPLTQNYLSVGARTMNPYQYIGLQHNGGGDAYGTVTRVVVSDTVKQAGQQHFFYTATGGISGGDMVGTADGVYLTGWECQYLDSSSSGNKNIAVIGHIDTYFRSTDAGTFGTVWMGVHQNSAGALPADAAFNVQGKWKSGLNTVMMTPNAAKAAISMAVNQRIYFDSTYAVDAAGVSLWGNVPGTTYIWDNSATGAMEHVVNNTSVFTYNQTDVFFQTGIKATFNNDVRLKQSFKLYFDANTGSPNTYITDDTGYLRFVYNGQDKVLITDSIVYLGNTGVQVQINQKPNLTSQTTGSTVGAAGSAAALPANPWTWLTIQIDGVDKKIPVYNV